MRKMGHKIIGYIDDYVGFGVPSDAKASFDCLYGLLQELGLTISSKKLIPPSTVVTCLGIEVNTEKGTLSIPTDKMVQISNMLQTWKSKKSCTKRQLQSLLGHLLYIHKCVKPTRYFLNRMLEVLRSAHNATHINLNPDFHRDLRWFLNFLPDFNGVALYDHKKVAFQVHLDACLQGLGDVFSNLVYHVPIPLEFSNLNIVHLEMINIVVVLKLFCNHWAKQSVKVFCDNIAVVQVLQSGSTRDPYLAAAARNVWLLAAKYDIDITYVHISGKSNRTADLLSRWTGSVKNCQELNSLVPNVIWMETSLSLLDLNCDI